MLDGPFWVARRDDFTLTLIMGEGEDPRTVDNIDGQITAGGVTYTATFLTTTAIDRVLAKWATTGEVGHGAYFWCSDLVIIPRPGTDAILAAVAELVHSTDLDTVCHAITDP